MRRDRASFCRCRRHAGIGSPKGNCISSGASKLRFPFRTLGDHGHHQPKRTSCPKAIKSPWKPANLVDEGVHGVSRFAPVWNMSMATGRSLAVHRVFVRRLHVTEVRFHCLQSCCYSPSAAGIRMNQLVSSLGQGMRCVEGVDFSASWGYAGTTPKSGCWLKLSST